MIRTSSAALILLFLTLTGLEAGAFSAQVAEARGTHQQTPSNHPAASEPKCQSTYEKSGVAISCDYVGIALSQKQAAPRVELNHASLSFDTREDNYLAGKLVFTNRSERSISEKRDVYLEIDDPSGANYIRRLLPAVDFRKLTPGQPVEFSIRFLSAAFVPRRYVIYLWIPSLDPSLKFKPANNFLISSAGVADPASGLNKVAEFAVDAATRRSQKSH